jgi:hypothetical protein
MTDEPRILHCRALLGLDAVVGQVRDADLGRPTPCGDWDLAALLAHLVGQDRGFAAAARDGDAPASAYEPVPFTPQAWQDSVHEPLSGDHVPDDEVVRAVLAVAEPIPDDERRERPGSAFARSLPDPGTDPWQRVLALLGRDPGWVPPPGAPIVGT